VSRLDARAAFDSDEVYIERFLGHCRHVEVQVLGDQHGNVVHLGERECSIQRRHQKVIEEAPCTSIGEDVRHRLGEAAVHGARALDFYSAGTLEFLVDDAGDFYFMEMNTRIQVEHGISELITGADIVREQLRVAAGEELGFAQSDVRLNGHAIECRVTAESGREFRPATGTVDELLLPGGPGVRVDTHLYCGYAVPAHYDSLLAKIMVHAPDRCAAIARMRRALAETEIRGVPNSLDTLRDVLADPKFVAGATYTDYFAPVAT
jgi:acetyl-CoA carboxylase biotin carboxylase subunit